ncbi:MAG: outer membrane protein assembly factor BamD [Candidatus Aminicenantes bacterium]|nr:outer membrane protein assembly factor BamD [Candidatus Aminicenantes bacterium]
MKAKSFPFNKINFSVFGLILLFLILFFEGCGKKETELTPEIASSDEALFKLGQQYLKKDPEKARLYFRQVIDSFPKSFFAQRAKLAIADSYFEKGDEGSMILAAAEYREFISLYPYSPSAAYAQYRIAMTYFLKAYKPGRDQTKTWQALTEFKKVVSLYPESQEAKEAQQKIKQCEERLAEHNFGIAHFYYKVYAFKASVERFQEIITTFPNYSKMDRVYFYLADSYYKWGKIDESIPYFSKVISDYPQSSLAKKAQERLKEIKQAKPGQKF